MGIKSLRAVTPAARHLNRDRCACFFHVVIFLKMAKHSGCWQTYRAFSRFSAGDMASGGGGTWGREIRLKLGMPAFDLTNLLPTASQASPNTVPAIQLAYGLVRCAGLMNLGYPVPTRFPTSTRVPDLPPPIRAFNRTKSPSCPTLPLPLLLPFLGIDV